jgi:hypothetical protein
MGQTPEARETDAATLVELRGRPRELWEELLPTEGKVARQWSGEAERALSK